MLQVDNENIIDIAAIGVESLECFWPSILPMIENPLLHDPLNQTADEVKQKILDEKYLLLLVFRNQRDVIAAQTLEMIRAKDGVICNLVTTGGTDLESWQDEMIATIEKIARDCGCYSMTTRGRIGWLKKLKRNGFNPRVFIAEKVL